MKNDNERTFEEIFKQNENRIYYHIQKLGIRDVYREFYMEGLYAMWMAYKKYEPDKGPLATYFNYTIRNRLIDTLRKKTTDHNHEEKFREIEMLRQTAGNTYGDRKLPIFESTGITLGNEQVDWQQIKAKLTEKQWKWVYYHIVEGMSLKEIAEQEGTSLEAVKSWGKAARRKLRRGDGL
ncbi:sigma-70 family RNA polymerase sigma factor [Oceanobacillus damuensis]|uniref:sigma-70 family RNA polymerase sigma factor n=1 Tax=Oceanobacillus damuensis TaxID=937928 RepID=UPI00082B7CD1|nr:sigma-70 family RNA polymerase sigma factor [Oceanobacillus damuensis]